MPAPTQKMPKEKGAEKSQKGRKGIEAVISARGRATQKRHSPSFEPASEFGRYPERPAVQGVHRGGARVAERPAFL